MKVGWIRIRARKISEPYPTAIFYSDPKHGTSHLIGEAVELEEQVQVLNTAHDGLIARVGEPDHGLEP